MLYVLHGDDIVSSRKRLSEIALPYTNCIYLDSEKTSAEDIMNALGSRDMFGEKKCVVIEKILKLPKKETENLLAILSNLNKETTVVLWHNTELSKATLAKFKNAQVESFMLPKLFFTFLDNFSPKNMKSEMETLTKMQNIEAEQIFYALIKRIRLLLYLKQNVLSDELAKVSPWQMDKLKTQSAKFTVKQLEKMYHELFEIEVKMKSGGLVLSLRKSLDILLIARLN